MGSILLLVLLSTPAQETASAQRVVYLGESRPYVLRFELTIQGRPLEQLLDDFAKREFARRDVNHSGTLDSEEQKRIHSHGALLQLGMASEKAAVLKALIDSPHLTVTDPSSLSRYYERIGFDRINLVAPGPELPAPHIVEIGSRVFKRLDASGDRQLNHAELREGVALVQKMDADANGALTLVELDGQRTQPRPRASGRIQADSRFVLAESESLEPTRLRAYAGLYTRDRAMIGKPCRHEDLSLPQELFRRMDQDQDGLLKLREWGRHFLESAPDVTLSIAFSAPDGLRETIVAAPQAPDVRVTANGNTWAALRIGPVPMLIRVQDIAVPDRMALTGLFRRLDSDANNTIRFSEAIWGLGWPVFRDIDADQNGRVEPEEFSQGLESFFDIGRGHVRITVDESARTLISILDQRKDGRISERELRSLPDLMEAWDLDADDAVTPEELSAIIIDVTSGFSIDPDISMQDASPRQAPPARRTTMPPTVPWFEKMDRNQDGDLSRREFPGSEELFQRLDTNEDGFIDAHEANAVMR